MELNPVLVWFVFHQLVPMGPLFHLVRCFPPQVGLGSARSQAGVGHALVGWFRCFRPFPPSAGLGPFPSASAFLFPCLFRVCPLRARCVGVCFSFLSFLRSPLGSWLSNFHLILIVISPSLLLIFTFISLQFGHALLPQGVCVARLYRR